MSQLPEDVIVDIFSRLPVKTLLRFRCVSKQFLSIIDGEYFVKRHLQYHSLQRKIIFQDVNMELFSLDLDLVDIACKLELPFKDWKRRVGFDIIGSCDGMLALTDFSVSDYSMGIWNISTRRHHLLPQCLTNYKHCFDDRNCQFDDGFGRHPNSNDYKFVRIVHLPNVTEVNVYSLKASCWKVIDCLPPYPEYLLLRGVAAVEGTLNWLGFPWDDNVKKYFILSYDLKNEKLSEVLLSDSIQNDRVSDLMVLGGCLCIVSGNHRHPFDIWVMKEYGLKDSWVKIYSFSASGPIPDKIPYQMFTFSNTGDQIIYVIGCREVICFDLKGGRYEIMSGWLPPTCIHRSRPCIFTATAYVESLVSLPKVNY